MKGILASVLRTRFLLFLVALSTFISSAAAQSLTYRVRAYVDGSSVLLLQGNTVRWHNLAFYAPGKFVDPDGTVHNDPTVITTATNGVTAMDGYNWYPNWPSGTLDGQFSDSLTTLAPALPAGEQSVSLRIIRARERVTVYQMPVIANGYTLGILFDDFATPNPDWYEVEVTVNVPPSGIGADWTTAFAQPDIARSSMNLVFDSGRQNVIMFGGRDAANPALNDTYEYAQTAWKKVLTPHAPPARFWYGMAYDSDRKRAVLFGGTNDSVRFGDTWQYDGFDWTQSVSAHSPPAQDGTTMVYDSCRRRTVMLDNQGGTWQYDGADWMNVVTAASAPPRRLAAMAFDAARCRTVLFGGLPNIGPLHSLGDTWEYDGSSWTEKTPAASPSGRWAHAMAYDSRRSRTVAFGGYGPLYPDGQQTNDMWEYDGNTWIEVLPNHAPSPREQHGFAFDPTRSRLILFGGGGVQDGMAMEYSSLPPCSYTLSPTNASFDTAAAMGSFGVLTDPTCGWLPMVNDSWITLLPGGGKGPGKVSYSVAANGGAARRGSISIGPRSFAIAQAGFTCSYSLGPDTASLGNGGGTARTVVNAPTGCTWAANSNAGWINIVSGASGNGSGTVVVNVSTNAGGARTGTVTIAGQTFTVTQGAGVCGAVDVTASMRVVQGQFRLVSIGFGTTTYTQSLTFTNASGSTIPGPVNFVMIGLPTHHHSTITDSGLAVAPAGSKLTSCFTAEGDYMIPISGSMAPNQTVSLGLTLLRGGWPLSYTVKMLSGNPSK